MKALRGCWPALVLLACEQQGVRGRDGQGVGMPTSGQQEACISKPVGQGELGYRRCLSHPRYSRAAEAEASKELAWGARQPGVPTAEALGHLFCVLDP